MGKFIQEFKEFALKGNVMDMAVGIIIGGAFGKIITSLVNDIIMPPIGSSQAAASATLRSSCAPQNSMQLVRLSRKQLS